MRHLNAEKIAILADSGADLAPEFLEKYPIYVVPFHVILTDRDYLSGIDISDQEIYDEMNKGIIPKTSMPSFYEIHEIMEKIRDDGYEKILVITISKMLSGTNNLMHLVAEEFEDELDIFIVNSKNLSMGTGLIILECARSIEAGRSWRDVKRICVRAVRLGKINFTLSTLEYIKKGGRIGPVAATIGGVLGIKPVITCDENGSFAVTEKIRGFDKGIRKISEITAEIAAECSRYSICLVYGESLPEIERVRKLAPEIFNRADLYLEQQVSPALCVHTGPGLLGFAILPEVYKDPARQKASEEA